jgi:hypothetical protein
MDSSTRLPSLAGIFSGRTCGPCGRNSQRRKIRCALHRTDPLVRLPVLGRAIYRRAKCCSTSAGDGSSGGFPRLFSPFLPPQQQTQQTAGYKTSVRLRCPRGVIFCSCNHELFKKSLCDRRLTSRFKMDI